MKKIALALSGGGARGIVHAELLSTLEEKGIKPCALSGTSIGALVGALYALGVSPQDIKERFFQARLSGTFRLGDISLVGGGVFESMQLINRLIPKDVSIEKLDIPLAICATDITHKKKKVFRSGSLKEALAASIAVPGVFSPRKIGDISYVDGGVVDPLPYRELPRSMIRVAHNITVKSNKNLNALNNVLFAFQLSQEQLIQLQRKQHPPDMYLETRLKEVGIFDFHHGDEMCKEVGSRIKSHVRKVCKLVNDSKFH